MKGFFFFTITLLCIAAPAAAHASIVISEVAYAGTQASQYEEWIELHNDGGDAVSLAGWKMFKSSTSLIALEGDIAAGNYVTICRTTGSVTDPLNGLCAIKGAFGGSGLSNTGEHLILKDNQGETVDEIALVDGAWPVKGVTKSESMQKGSSGWFKAAPTPGAENVEPNEEENPDSELPNPTLPPIVTTDSTKEEVEAVKKDPRFVARTVGPDQLPLGSPATFTVHVRQDGKRDMVSGKFEWYTGDGASYVFHSNQPLTHTYAAPGDYQVTLVYFSGDMKDEPDSIHRRKIAVFDPKPSISLEDGNIVITNGSLKDVDLGSWSIVCGASSYTLANYTLIKKEASLTVPPRILGFWPTSCKAFLVSPGGATRISEDPPYPENTGADDQGEQPPEPSEPVSLERPSLSAEPPRQKSFSEVLQEYGWYLGGGAVALAVLASLAVRLYATGSMLPEGEDEDL